MFAVLKREFRSYFQNVVGWLFVAALMALFGLYFYVYNLRQGYPYLYYTLSAITIIFMIAVPILTMRSFTFIIVRVQNQTVDPHELLYLFGHRVKGFAAYLRFAAGDAEDALRPRVIGNVPGYPAAVGKQGAALIGGVKGVPAYVIVGAVHPQKIQHRGQKVGGVQRLAYLHGLQIRAPDEAGRLFQQQGIAHPGKGVQGRFVLVALGVER